MDIRQSLLFAIGMLIFWSLAEASTHMNYNLLQPNVEYQIETRRKSKVLDLSSTTLQENKLISSHNEINTGGRTFGALKRMRIAIPAIMYKLGVMTTILGFLVLFALKGLLIGVIILVLQLSSALSKLHGLKKEHGEESWHPQKDIHVHIHGGGDSGHYVYPSSEHHHSPYSAWSKSSGPVPSKLDYNYYYSKLKELKELRDLRDSLYSQEV